MPLKRCLFALIAGTVFVGRTVAGEDAFGPRPHDAPSVFFIARSSNKNQVHYGVRLDAACEIRGESPVYAYWRMFENRGALEPLLGIEAPAYGLDEQQLVQRSAGVTTIRIKLRAFPDRPLTVVVAKKGGSCVATASTEIGGVEVRLQSIYVKVKWPFGIDYVLLRGTTQEGRPVEELVRN